MDVVLYIELILSQVESNLDKEAVREVKHYLKHNEYEIAFEGLFYEIMKMNPMPSIDWEVGLFYAKQLGLDKESIIDVAFWDKLLETKNRLIG